MLDHHRALIYTMVIVSAADSELPDAELRIIGDIVDDLPVFRDFDRHELPKALNDCTELIGRENGLEVTLSTIKTALPASYARPPMQSPAIWLRPTGKRARRN